MISTNLQRLQESNERIRLNIANAYEKAGEKGASLSDVQNSGNLAGTIESIPQEGSSGWKPQEDWWDIDSILENNTEDYPAKMICLLTDSSITTTIFGWKAAKIETSDGVEYVEDNLTTIEHTWNREYDKECGLGYKTRYIIYYFDSSEIKVASTYGKIPNETLYCILKNMNITVAENHVGGIFVSRALLEYIKCIDTIFTNHPNLYYCQNLRNIEKLKYITYNSSSSRPYSNCYKLQEIYVDTLPANAQYFFENSGITKIDVDTSNTTSFNNCFINCKVMIITKLDFNLATEVTNMFSGCYWLIAICEISNIKKSGINFSSCSRLNYDTLIRVIEALYDYSDDTEGTHTITLGATNLAKLTDEELAIGQNKGWTIS